MPKFAGILPALVTPLAEDHSLLNRPYEALLERVYSAGCHGVYVCGNTGEGLALPPATRREAAEVACRNAPSGALTVVHVGAYDPAEAFGLAAHAAGCGASAVSSLPPRDAADFAGVKRYYTDLAASSDLPVLIYYFPQFSSAISTTDQVLELCTIPNVVGLKFTDFDIYRLSLLRRAGLPVFNGRDEVLAAGLLMNASGGIGSFYNVFPRMVVDIYNFAHSGHWAEARAIQHHLNHFIEIVLRFPMIPALKTMLGWCGLDYGISLQDPVRLTPDQEQDLVAQLHAYAPHLDLLAADPQVARIR
ncbi:dihydrodipicolinate synthase family protein [Paludibaculum fermentans]|uniref:dihydrodipicolinate synthase family protein n=1 Tax=Paludibaculum fermentans TaxID=1473598 RepID=UPI003EBE680F